MVSWTGSTDHRIKDRKEGQTSGGSFNLGQCRKVQPGRQISGVVSCSATVRFASPSAPAVRYAQRQLAEGSLRFTLGTTYRGTNLWLAWIGR